MPRKIAGIGVFAFLCGIILIYQPPALFIHFSPQVYYFGISVSVLGIILIGLGLHHASRR